MHYLVYVETLSCLLSIQLKSMPAYLFVWKVFAQTACTFFYFSRGVGQFFINITLLAKYLLLA